MGYLLIGVSERMHPGILTCWCWCAVSQVHCGRRLLCTFVILAGVLCHRCIVGYLLVGVLCDRCIMGYLLIGVSERVHPGILTCWCWCAVSQVHRGRRLLCTCVIPAGVLCHRCIVGYLLIGVLCDRCIMGDGVHSVHS